MMLNKIRQNILVFIMLVNIIITPNALADFDGSTLTNIDTYSWDFNSIWDDISDIGNRLYESASQVVDYAKETGGNIADYFENRDWNAAWQRTKENAIKDLQLMANAYVALGKQLFIDDDETFGWIKSASLAIDWAQCVVGDVKTCKDYLKQVSVAISHATIDALETDDRYRSEEDAKKCKELIDKISDAIDSGSDLLGAMDDIKGSKDTKDYLSALEEIIDAAGEISESKDSISKIINDLRQDSEKDPGGNSIEPDSDDDDSQLSRQVLERKEALEQKTLQMRTLERKPVLEMKILERKPVLEMKLLERKPVPEMKTLKRRKVSL